MQSIRTRTVPPIRWRSTALGGLLALAFALPACSDAGRATAPESAARDESNIPHYVETTPGAAEVVSTQTVQLSAVLKNRAGETVEGRTAIAWSSGDESVATVDGTGLVRGARGVPVHGVGFQSHFGLGSTPSAEQLKQSIDRFAALGLAVQITELDVTVPLDRQNAEGFAQQAAEFRRVAEVCMEHPACDTVVVWGVDDGNSWRAANRPTLFDAAFNPKPAYFSVLDQLAGR